MSRFRLITGVLLLALCAAFGTWLYRALPAALSFEAMGERYELLAPPMLALLCVLPLLLWGAAGSLTDLPLAQRVLSFAARALLVVLLALALARLSRTTDATLISTVFLVDVSDSVTDADLARAGELVERALAARGEHDVQLVTFAAHPRRVALAQSGPSKVALTRHEGEGAGAGSDLQAALQLAYGLFPPGHLRRVVLVSDGRETRGDLLQESMRANRFGVRIFHHVLEAGRPREVAVRALELPDSIEVGESFEVRAHVYATHPDMARLRLYQGEVLNGLDGVREVELERGDNEIVFRSVVRVPGSLPYRVEVAPQGEDHVSHNNQATSLAVVPGRPTVLIVDRAPEQVRHLAQALHAADYEVEVRGAAALPRSLAELQRYDFFILSDVPAERVSLSQMELIERYVRDLGGGFMMAGGEQSFGLGGYQGTRMEQLLPVRMHSERQRDEHSLALALVIDTSGSMSGQKIELAKEAAKATGALLGPHDSLAVIGFSGEPERTVRMQSARNRVRIAQDIAQLNAQGGTAIFPALDMAFQDLLTTRARVKHVILLTDGQTQESGIEELVQAMHAEAITVSTVGLGSDVNRSLLQTAANNGGGRAYFTSDPHNVPRIFTRETSTVGKNSAVEDLVQAVVVEPADFLKGLNIHHAPYLRGYVATEAKPRPVQAVLRSDLGEPLLARYRVGLGWSLAWTSDVKARWAAEWLRWRSFGPFFAQLVREHMRRDRLDELPMEVRLHDDRLEVSVDALGQDDRFLNGLSSQVVVEGPTGAPSSKRITAPLAQRAPGRYEARVPLSGYGSFAVSATHEHEGRLIARSHAQLSRPYPREYEVSEPQAGLLARASAVTGGGALADAGAVFEVGEERIESHVDLWPELTLAALVLLLFDLALRRLRLFDRRLQSGRRAAEPAVSKPSAG